MKKILILLLLSLSINSHANNNELASTISIVILGSIILSDKISTIGDSTHQEDKRLKVTEILPKEDKTIIKALPESGREIVDLELPTTTIKSTQLEVGQYIEVEKVTSGYILTVNDKVLAINPNSTTAPLFKQEKL